MSCESTILSWCPCPQQAKMALAGSNRWDEPCHFREIDQFTQTLLHKTQHKVHHSQHSSLSGTASSVNFREHNRKKSYHREWHKHSLLKAPLYLPSPGSAQMTSAFEILSKSSFRNHSKLIPRQKSCHSPAMQVAGRSLLPGIQKERTRHNDLALERSKDEA